MIMQSSQDLIHFIVTAALSFLIGLEIRTYRQQFHPNEQGLFIGTARTFTFVGMLGYIGYMIAPESLIVYVAILLALSALYALFYYRKLERNKSSILLFLVMLCVYSIGPLTQIAPLWMPSLIFVLTVFILNAGMGIHRFCIQINPYEFETLGKMILLSAVILPLLPDSKIVDFIPLSPFKIWLAVVVVSAISYGGYIVQKYLLPRRGYFVTGIIGGTYSSTATTVVLARKAKGSAYRPVIEASIIASTAVMYIRLAAIALIFDLSIGKALLWPFLALSAAGMAASIFFLGRDHTQQEKSDFVDSNPLELGTALLFALLFVAMMILTQFVTARFGSGGLEIFSFVVGLTDIDPFVLSLLTGKYAVSAQQITAAVMIAAGGNNLLKAAYALWFGGWKNTYRSAAVIALLGIATTGWALYMEGLFA